MSRTLARLVLFLLAIAGLPLVALAAEAPAATTSQWISLLVGLVALVPSIVTGLTRYERPTSVYGWIKAGLDVLSLVVHKDSPGTFNLPGMRSAPPVGTLTIPHGVRIDPSPPSTDAGGLISALLLFGALGGVAHADAIAQVTAPVVVTAPAPAPSPDLALKLGLVDAQFHALADQLGVPLQTKLPPSFFDTTAGKALTITLSVVGACLAVAQTSATIYLQVN